MDIKELIEKVVDAIKDNDNIKEQFETATEDELITLLSTNGMLVKRPL